MNRNLLVNALLALGFLSCASTPARAEVQRLVVPCGAAACLWDRPRLDPPAGWSVDEEWSARLQQLVFVPAGSAMAVAPARIIARTLDAAAEPDLARLIEHEQDRALGGSLTLVAVRGSALSAGAGPAWPTLTVASRDPAASRQTLAFGRDGAFWVVLLLDAVNPTEHEHALPALRALLAGYRPVLAPEAATPSPAIAPSASRVKKERTAP